MPNLKWSQPKMNPEVKAKWVAALRSKQYKQGKFSLRNKYNEFCCLGVLCNIHAQEHPEIAALQTNPTSYLGSKELLPDEVAVWADLLGYGGGSVTIGGELMPLSQHNDIGRTFEEIADAVEKYL